jgi:hypothetical protein
MVKKFPVGMFVLLRRFPTLQVHISAMKSRPSEDSEAQVNTPTLTVQAPEPLGLVPDVAGFFVVYPDAWRKCLVVEHYTTAGGLDCVIEGRTPAALWNAVIARHLVSRLDHAACLGRELTRAERSLQTGETYAQDRAPGDLRPASTDHTGAYSCSHEAYMICPQSFSTDLSK